MEKANAPGTGHSQNETGGDSNAPPGQVRTGPNYFIMSAWRAFLMALPNNRW